MNSLSQSATADELSQHRPLLLAHCYRMLGSPVDASDAVQDTFVKATRALESYRGEASLQTWLLRIATHVCLDELKDRKRRERPMAWPSGEPDGPLTMRPPEEWLEPIPESWLTPTNLTPLEALELRGSVRLALVAAFQYLPPKQRAALLLTQVLGCSAAEAAEMLDTTVASVNSALQRARTKLDSLPMEDSPRTSAQDRLVEQYVKAFESYHVDNLVSLLTDDIEFSMPPITLWLEGPERVGTFLKTTGHECEGSILVPTSANGSPAFGQYRDGGRTPWGLVVLTLRNDRISGITTFLDHKTLFPLFGLPPQA